MTLVDFVLVCIYSVGLRWCIFRYQKFGWLQDWLKNNTNDLLRELGSCVYCQTIEAAVVVQLVLQQYDLRHIVFASLSIGLLAALADSWLEGLLLKEGQDAK